MWVAIGVGVVVLLLIVWVVAIYNGLIGKRNQVRNAWSQIDVQLKRRHDLIPNLVSAVQGYMQHEREVLENVTNARAAAIAAGNNVGQRAQAESQLSQSLRSLFAVAENYPQLRANENMLALQEELSSTENRIAFSRQFYNDSVQSYNTSRETFPSVIVSNSLGFRQESLFTLDDIADRVVPTVSFS
jgi:LemA protein